MRIVLVGSPSDRARLRAGLDGSIDVVAEFASLAAARRSDVDADAIMIAGEHHPATASDDQDEEDEGFEEPLTPREIQVLELLPPAFPTTPIPARLPITAQPAHS